MRIVKIRWHDAVVDSGKTPMSSFDDDYEGPLPCESVGYVVADNDDYMSVATTLQYNPDNYVEITTIPRGCIESVEYLTTAM